MHFQRQSTGKKRQMVYVPEVNEASFLFFFERSGSWSLRDYSVPHTVREIRPRDLGWTADMVRMKARHSFDAPTIETTDLAHWHQHTQELNRTILRKASGETPEVGKFLPVTAPATGRSAGHPVINREELEAALQTRRNSEPGRMLTSANSEDWVTWNVMNLLPIVLEDSWWDHVVGLARLANPELQAVELGSVAPKMKFWLGVASPASYEAASRARMRVSPDPSFRGRSLNPAPVEGESEIDVAFIADGLRIFVEAKLGSDISLRTTYDPERNQVARNIDCLIEASHGEPALFWMFVRDKAASRAYMQVVEEYRRNPAALARLLPHRDPGELKRIVAGITVITWRELAEPILAATDLEYPMFPEVCDELGRRI